MKKVASALLIIAIFVTAYTSETAAQSYISYFYTAGEAVIIAPIDGTTMSIRDISDPSNIVWAGSSPSAWESGAIFVRLPPYDSLPLPAGYYSIKSSQKISLLVGNPSSGGETNTTGYYALDVQGRPCGTEVYTHRLDEEKDESTGIVFSDHDNNSVEICNR